MNNPTGEVNRTAEEWQQAFKKFDDFAEADVLAFEERCRSLKRVEADELRREKANELTQVAAVEGLIGQPINIMSSGARAVAIDTNNPCLVEINDCFGFSGEFSGIVLNEGGALSYEAKFPVQQLNTLWLEGELRAKGNIPIGLGSTH